MSAGKSALVASVTLALLAVTPSIKGLRTSSSAQLGGSGPSNTGNRLLCGRYSLSFSADVIPVGKIAGAGVVASDCHGNLSDGKETITDGNGNVCEGGLAGTYSLNSNGFGNASLSFVPTNPSLACPIVNFTEALAVGQNGSIVKAVNTGSGEVTTQEEWVQQR